MRRLFLLLSLLIVLVLPVAAQDDAELVTIADVVTTTAEGDDPEFTILLAALQAADPIFLELLADPEQSVTVFAPTDDAFEELLEALGATPEGLLADRLLVNDLLSYHVIPAEYSSEAIVGMNGALVGTLLRGEQLQISTDGATVFINASEVIDPDLFASNGIVHVIDTVLAPAPEETPAPSGTLADIVVANAEDSSPEFTTLLTAVQAADPLFLEALTGDLPYTVFAPTDAAFNAALQELGLTAEELLEDTEQLNAILSYHIVPGLFTSDELISTYFSVTGTPSLGSLLPGITLDILFENNAIVINYATVLLPDILATNGVIHVIDAVLIPPT